MVFHGTRLVFHRAERRRREARHETYITPKLVTTRRSILGPPAEGRPGPSDDDDDEWLVQRPGGRSTNGPAALDDQREKTTLGIDGDDDDCADRDRWR